MKRSVATTKLTKDYIESKISQEAIVSKYLNLDIKTVEYCIKYNRLIPSVFRDDGDTPSMGIQYNKKGRLKVRDFGGFGFFEDIYGVVAYVLSSIYERKIETNNKNDFYFILKHIAMTFSKVIDGEEIDPNIDETIKNALVKSKNRRPIIDLVTRSWNKDDKEIWAKWNVNLQFLNRNFVIPVEQYYINRSVESDPKYYYNKKDPCYAYLLGEKQGIRLIKLYFPLRNRQTELKFITNCNVIEGLLNLELDNYDYILITKSSKDRLSIGSYLSHHSFYGGVDKINIGVVNLPSESYLLKDNEYSYLNNKLKSNGMIISLLDFDRTGRRGANHMAITYNIPYLFITRGEFGLPNYHAKDFTDLHNTYNNKEIEQFINETLTYVRIKYRKYDEGEIAQFGSEESDFNF